MTPEQLKQVRRVEFSNAARSLPITPDIHDLGDLQLSFQPFEQLVVEMLKVIRSHQFAALFSFHPSEITPRFDHPDHLMAGKLTQFVGATADVHHFHPEFPATHQRPELYLWASVDHLASHHLLLTVEHRQRRDQYLVDHYPSQFILDQKDQWAPIFDQITYDKASGEHQEKWLRVR